MHYEFLGDPDHILRSSGVPGATSSARRTDLTDGGS